MATKEQYGEFLKNKMVDFEKQNGGF